MCAHTLSILPLCRERAKSQLARQQSGPIPQPFEIKPTSLAVIQETGGSDSEAAAKRSPRARSPARWRGTLQQSRLHIEEVQGISRSEWGCGLMGMGGVRGGANSTLCCPCRGHELLKEVYCFNQKYFLCFSYPF